ncbi:Wadjet anti-phage system protein JetD domain-containing protein [Frigoribacterium sp. PhB116]|uniref:Wadjet anti-phage system protein JetD domain-containing protein n=1 Tax=Frigoribacterium sp. PhB116 TaxID=2485174 RepID=UPI001FBBC53B|nr:Wadjet anti-phage system protein JetD domain-containing protein [Frigoribacterium sp. PhB116]
MLGPADLRAAAAAKYAREARTWAADPTSSPRLDVPLHPPTQATALRVGPDAPAWARSWRDPGFAAEVLWETRNWASVGTQQVPVRCVIEGTEAIAAAAGTTGEWLLLRHRSDVLRERWGGRGVDEALASAIRTETPRLLDLGPLDFDLLLGVLDWVAANPTSGLYLRQLPIHGIHTKWIESHRRLVFAFVGAVTGESTLGLASSPSLIRLRVLDARLRPAGIGDLAVPAATLTAWAPAPTTVFVFENLETVLAMPDLPGAVVVHGSGYAVDRLAAVPWIQSSRIVYWGDLDSHGFAILDTIRRGCDDVRSVLMDEATLDAHADLIGHEASPHRGVLARLTPGESTALHRLRDGGDLRLEQERIDWRFAVDALVSA